MILAIRFGVLGSESIVQEAGSRSSQYLLLVRLCKKYGEGVQRLLLAILWGHIYQKMPRRLGREQYWVWFTPPHSLR